MKKFVIIFLAMFYLSGCSLTTGEPPETRVAKQVNSQPPAKMQKRDNTVYAVEQKDLVNYKYVSDVNLDTRKPMFFVKNADDENAGDNAFSYDQFICDNVNALVSKKYTCLVYKIKKDQKIANFLTAKLDGTPSEAVLGDFVIVNISDLIAYYKNEESSLKGYPDLDVVSFLNGDYLYVLGNNEAKASNIDHFFKYILGSKDDSVTIAYTNEESKRLIIEVLKLMLSNPKVELVRTSELDGSYVPDLIVDYGATLSTGVKKYISANKVFSPLNINDKYLKSLQKTNKYMSVANVAGFYKTDDLVSFNSFLKEENKTPNNNVSAYNDSENSDVAESDKNGDYYFKLKETQDILKVDQFADAGIGDSRVMSVGLRKVLVARKFTDTDEVATVLGVFVESIKGPLEAHNSPDVRGYSYSDLMTAGLDKATIDILNYHQGVFLYASLKNSITGNEEAKNAVDDIIKDNIPNKTSLYGPEFPTSDEVKKIDDSAKSEKVQAETDQIISNYNGLLNNLQEELKGLDNNQVPLNDYSNRPAIKAPVSGQNNSAQVVQPQPSSQPQVTPAPVPAANPPAPASVNNNVPVPSAAVSVAPNNANTPAVSSTNTATSSNVNNNANSGNTVSSGSASGLSNSESSLSN